MDDSFAAPSAATVRACCAPVQLLHTSTGMTSYGGLVDRQSSSPHALSHIPFYRTPVFATTAPALFSGAVLAVLFSPYDRALYLRVHHRRRFLDRTNWTTPFHGFANAAVYRTVCSGAYLVWQDTAKWGLGRGAQDIVGGGGFSPATSRGQEESSLLTNIAIGTFAGSMNGLLLNPLQWIKYRMWTEGSGTFWSVARRVAHEGGPTVFLRGVRVSVGRDVVFGVFYEALRAPYHCFSRTGQTEPRAGITQFFVNVCAACTASCFSAPLNYSRNVTYGASLQSCPLPTTRLLTQLWLSTLQEPTWHRRWLHLNGKLNITLGSFRVGLGMGVGQGIFQWAKGLLNG